MGSLLKDLPASSSQAPNPEPTTGRSRVKFAPGGGTEGGLDAEALNLTRSILSTNTNDRKEADEIGAKKTNVDLVQQTLKTSSVTLPTPKSAEKTSALDAEAIRITDTFLHQGNEEHSEAPKVEKVPTKVEKVPTKGILKKAKEPDRLETGIHGKEQPEKVSQLKENIKNETKKTLPDQTNQGEIIAEAVSKQDEKAGKVHTINEVKSERTAALPTGNIINSAKKNDVNLNNQRKEIVSDKKEGKGNEKEAKVISAADNSKSSQRVQLEALLITKAKTEPKTSNSITNQDTKKVKDPPTVVAPSPNSRTTSMSSAVPLDTSETATNSKSGQPSGSKISPGIKETSTTDIKPATPSQPASFGSNLGVSQHSSNFYPAQPAVINKSAAGPKLEVKHAQQKMMINSPLSPSSSRKELTSKTNEDAPQIYSHLSGRTIAQEKGGAIKGPDPSVKSDIENLDSQHSEKMKEIQSRHEEREKKKLIPPMTFTSSSVAHSSSSSSSTSVKETTNVQAGKGEGQTSRPDQVKTQTVEGTRANKPVVTSILKDVTSDLKKLDNGHDVHMKQIEEKFKEQELRTRQPPSTDHHSARPANLGRSRFETGSAGPASGSSSRVDAKVAADNLRTQFELDRHIPRRNETVHDMTSTITRESSSVARSATTILDVKQKTPEPRRKLENNVKVSPDTGYASPLPRKKFDRNFNASPEPFPASKPTSNSRFSDSSSSYNRPTGSPSKSSSTYISSPSNSLSTSKSYSNSSYSTPSSYSTNSFASPSSSYSSSTSFPSPADSFSSSITSSSSYFAATPATSYSSSLLDRSRSEAVIANSKSSADLSARIQATKDQHKLDIKKAMDFDRTSLKPPIISQKLPRPEPGKYSNLSSMTSTMERSEREGRRMERERAVLERVLGDRSSRGKSDDLLAKTPSYRL